MANRFKRRRPFFKKSKRIGEGEEFPSKAQRKANRITKMKKGIFILPSLLTLTSIFFAFYSVICSIKGNFFLAAALILVAAFFDGVDGKVARLTKTTTRFGLELDSLADVISFGVAPAILMYMWVLDSYARLGWVSAFVFVSCGALRLARFNVQSGSIDPKRFNGLPIPAAACMVATTVLFFDHFKVDPFGFRLGLIILTYLLSFLMVSAVKFHAFKDLTLVKQKPFLSTVGFVLLLALIATWPFVVPFFLCSAYLVSGPILTLVLRLRARGSAQEAGSGIPQAGPQDTPPEPTLQP